MRNEFCQHMFTKYQYYVCVTKQFSHNHQAEQKSKSNKIR